MIFPDLAGLAQRFWAKVEHTETCWLWHGTRDRSWGYGRFHVGARRGKRMARAHRVAWLLSGGTLTAPDVVMHRCDVPWCVRPDHLVVGTHVENMATMAAKGRARCSRGVLNPNRRLNPTQVHQIRLMVREGRSQDRVAEHFGIAQSHVSRIVLRQAWGEDG